MSSFITHQNTPFGVTLTPAERGSDMADVPGETLRALARKHHIVLLRNFAGVHDLESLLTFSRALGELLEWPFGHVLELIEKDDPEDHIFDHSHMPMHWDGMYMPVVPEFQIFHCVRAPPAKDGGETTFSNTSLALKNAHPATVAQWSRVTGHYRRKMAFYDSHTIAPLVTRHPTTAEPVIRYNEIARDDGRGFVNPPDIKFTGSSADELEQVHRSLIQALYDPRHLYTHAWREGDLVITDNFTLLHGRNAFTAKAPRHLRRVHVKGIVNPHLVQ